MIRQPQALRRADAAATAGPSLWLISFTDLISLMLAFFVLIYAMREPESPNAAPEDVAVTARSMASTPSEWTAQPRAARNVLSVEERSAVNLDYLGTLLRSQFAQSPTLSGLSVTREDDRLVIAAPLDRLFEPNGLTPSSDGRDALHLLAPSLDRVGNRIEVVGRVTPSGTAGATADDAVWERALTRAVMVASTLRDAGYRDDLVARAAFTRETAADGGEFEGGAGVDLVIREREETR